MLIYGFFSLHIQEVVRVMKEPPSSSPQGGSRV